jgi:hypothetical protein
MAARRPGRPDSADGGQRQPGRAVPNDPAGAGVVPGISWPPAAGGGTMQAWLYALYALSLAVAAGLMYWSFAA